MDRLSKERRSWLMSRVRSANTGPELAVRSLIHGLGFRFRLHRKDLPGRPDVVLPRHGKVVFVHGCFWHGHACKRFKMPKSRVEYWAEKIEANRARDRRNIRDLRRLGWQVLVVRECELKDESRLLRKLERFLGGPDEITR